VEDEPGLARRRVQTAINELQEVLEALDGRAPA
jgi:hypothetical protein